MFLLDSEMETAPGKSQSNAFDVWLISWNIIYSIKQTMIS